MTSYGDIGLLSTPQAPLTPSNWSALYRGRGSPVMSWIFLKANNGQQASGVGDKRFFRFKRNAYHLWTTIIRHRLNDITHQQVMCFNQGSKFANIFKVHLKHPQCFGTLAQPFTSCRIRPSWRNGSSLGPHVFYPTLGCDIQGFGAMGLSVQYWPRWFQDFRRSDWLCHSEQMGPIWGYVPCQKKIFFVCEISCFWVK